MGKYFFTIANYVLQQPNDKILQILVSVDGFHGQQISERTVHVGVAIRNLM